MGQCGNSDAITDLSLYIVTDYYVHYYQIQWVP